MSEKKTTGWRGPEPNRNGRPKGSRNKTTNRIREAYQNLVELNLDNMSLWIQEVAENDPHKALDTMIKLSDYIIPRLARQEVTGADGADLLKNVKFEFGPDVNDKEERDQTLEE